jgi:hypothetical protein
MAAKSANRAAQKELGEIVRALSQIQSAVVVSVAALRHQNCELDADISSVLQRSVADRIHEQIERLELLSGRRAGIQ